MKNVYKIDTSHWYITRLTYLIAGSVTFAATITHFLTGLTWPLWFALFMGLVQMIFALTGYCPGAIIMDKCGVPRE
jgi:hypothetical protein